MKFYEFYEFEYYALIGAEDEDNAMIGYTEVVADIVKDEEDFHPSMISKDEALERFKKGNIQGCKTEEDKIKDFNNQINNFNEYVSKGSEPYIVFLIDGCLY